MATFTWNGESGDCLDPAMMLEVNAYASLAIDGHATNYGSIVVERPGFAGHYAGTGQYPMTIAKSRHHVAAATTPLFRGAGSAGYHPGR